jgi:hypothetical protein
MSEQIDHRGIAVDNKRWLRNKKDGEIYGWNEIIAQNPNVEEVTEEEAFPEKFVPKAQKKRKPKLSLKTKNIPEAPPRTIPELSEEASKGLPK